MLAPLGAPRGAVPAAPWAPKEGGGLDRLGPTEAFVGLSLFGFVLLFAFRLFIIVFEPLEPQAVGRTNQQSTISP